MKIRQIGKEMISREKMWIFENSAQEDQGGERRNCIELHRIAFTKKT